VIETPKYSLWVVQICPKQIQDGGRPPSWKIKKILISLQPIDWFWQNLACWCVSTLWTPVINKISRFQKCKMAAAAILKIRKIAISPQQNDRFWRNLLQWCVWRVCVNKNSRFQKSKMAAAAILKNLEFYVRPGVFGMISWFTLVLTL